jgi:hypothetical protein
MIETVQTNKRELFFLMPMAFSYVSGCDQDGRQDTIDAADTSCETSNNWRYGMDSILFFI